MPKIRGIKPDYWTDEDIVDLTIPARLLFIGLWSYACDNGHLQDKSKQIKMRLLPGDDINCAELLRELEISGRITRSDGWITVPNFVKHQRPDKRYFQTCDKPGCGKPDGDSQPATRSGPHEPTTSTPRALVVGSQSTPGDGDGDGEMKVSTSPTSTRGPRSADADREFDEWWSHYPRKVGKGAAKKAYRAARKTASVDDLRDGLRRQLPMMSKAEPQFIPHAATWLHAERWLDEPPTQPHVVDWMNP